MVRNNRVPEYRGTEKVKFVGGVGRLGRRPGWVPKLCFCLPFSRQTNEDRIDPQITVLKLYLGFSARVRVRSRGRASRRQSKMTPRFGRKKKRTLVDKVLLLSNNCTAGTADNHVAFLLCVYMRRNWGTLPQKRASFCSLPQDDRTITPPRKYILAVLLQL